MLKFIFYSELNTSQAAEKILKEYPQGKDRDEIIQFIKSSKRGIIKKVSEE
jgi:UDP-N-acetylglucosamine acyltransferase